ncbi:MAG: T9SS type A sorting domain-containing protein [Lewinella sp.]|uniref:T9SS type A sorting domain-containing protein n=1 Tax=Lewinella sp. TaxID=2004506 RepID=UPI003D6BDA12
MKPFLPNFAWSIFSPQSIRFLFIPLLVLGAISFANAQAYPGCDDIRYRTDVFTEVQSTLGLSYGSGTTIAGNTQELFLDVYEPVGDEQAIRPVIILAFGGSFISGEREDLAGLCESYARRGFVAVSIDYRLYDLPLIPFPTSDEMRDVVVRSISDFKAAIRYMREDAATSNTFRVDPDMVFIGGVSAGGIAAAHTAVLDETDDIDADLLALIEANGGFTGNSSDNTEYSNEVQGYISLSGALNDASWMDENDPPFASVHDDMDIVVPYNTGFASLLGVQIVYLEGSLQLQLKGDSLDIPNRLLTIENSFDHVSYFGTPEEYTATIDFTTEFLQDIMCEQLVGTNDQPEVLGGIRNFPNPATDRIQVTNPEGLLLNLSLFNSMGQRVTQRQNTTELMVGQLPAGIYWLHVEDYATRASTIQKVIIK